MHSPARILLTGDTEGGVFTFVGDLAAELIQCGWQVSLATIGPSLSDAQSEMLSSLATLQWHHRSSKLEWMDNPWDNVESTGKWLARLAQDFQPDVVHLNTLSYGDLNLSVPVVQTVHSCVLSWWDAVERSPLPAAWYRYRDHVQSSLNGATMITAPSKAALRTVEQHYFTERSTAFAIYNGTNAELFTAKLKEPFVLSAGRLWDKAKNLIALAEISQDLAWPVKLAGRLNDVCQSSPFSGCEILGQLSRRELGNYYGRAAIYVMPAKYEPFGLSILEAALSGCALVLGDIPTLREVWGNDAIYVQPDDRSSLLASIQSLIADETWRNQMSDRASQRAAQFSAKTMAKDYQELYFAAMSHHRSYRCAS